MYFTHGILILDLSTYLAPLKLALNPTKKSKNKNYNSTSICPIVKGKGQEDPGLKDQTQKDPDPKDHGPKDPQN